MTEDDFTPEELAQFEADADEAERGYSIEFLRSCKRVGGRPLEVGDEAAAVLQFRLDPARIAGIDALADRNNETRSDVIRRAIDRELAAA